MCRMLKVTQFFSKGPFIIDGSGWAGKNEGWVTSNSRQSEGGGGHQEICTQRGGATCFFILFYFPIAPLGLTGIDGLQASKKGQQFMATNDNVPILRPKRDWRGNCTTGTVSSSDSFGP